MSDPSGDPNELPAEELEEAARSETEQNTEWWNEQWLKFPTISLDDQGQWHYWDVPEETGIYAEDWRVGESLARDTVAHMQSFMAGSSALRRIMHEIDFNSIIGQGFLSRIEDMLANPGMYLESLEPGSVRKKLASLAEQTETTNGSTH